MILNDIRSFLFGINNPINPKIPEPAPPIINLDPVLMSKLLVQDFNFPSKDPTDPILYQKFGNVISPKGTSFNYKSKEADYN